MSIDGSAVLILTWRGPPRSDGCVFGNRSRSKRRRTGKSQRPEQIIPGLEQEIGRDGPHALEEPLTGHQFPPRRSPGPIPQFTDGMTGEGQQIEDREVLSPDAAYRARSYAPGCIPWF